MAISRREGKAFKARVRRELAAKMRADDRAKLRILRGDIRTAKAERREQMRDAVRRCRDERQSAKERAAELRREARARLQEAIRLEKSGAAHRCSVRKTEIRTSGETKAQKARAALAAERHYQAEIRELAKSAKERRRTTTKERREESAGEVEANLPPDLHGVWKAVASSVRGTHRMSRTEAFLLWAERHPEEVIAYQADSAERRVEALLAEQKKTEARLRKGTGGYSRAARAQLEAAPF